LEELERTNPTDIPPSSFLPPLAPGALASSPAGAREKKKQSANVRRILYNKKTLRDWLDELPTDPRPPYLLAAAPPPAAPPRALCTSCGYIGAYRCERCREWSCSVECKTVHVRDGGCRVGR